MTKQEIIAKLNETMHGIDEQEEQARTLIWNHGISSRLQQDASVFFEEKRREATNNAMEKLLDVMEEEKEMADLNMNKEFLTNLDKALPPTSGSINTYTGIEENWCRTWSSRQFDSE